MTAFEDLSREAEVKGSSDRSFGAVFTTVFLVVALFPLLKGHPIRAWALWPTVALAIVTALRPSLLRHVNRLWMRFGLLLGRIATPMILGLLLYAVFTPIGLLLRLFGKDLLRLKREPSAPSYWIRRSPPGPPPESMSDQF